MAIRAAGLVALAFACMATAIEDPNEAAGREKAAEFTKLSKDGGGLASVTDRNFDNLVRSPHRSYHTFILFNAKDPAYNCQLCGPFEDEIEVLASSYWRQKQKDPNAPEIFFARAEFGPNKEVFKGYNMQNVPALVYFGPTASKSHSSKSFPGTGAQYANELDAENAALFVRDKTDYKVEIYRSPWSKIITALLVLGALGFGLYFSREHLTAIAFWLQKQTFIWVIAGLAIYFISVSGFLYDIIRGVPTFGYDAKAKKLVVVSQQSGTQYGAEGAIVGMLNIGAGLAVIALSRIIPRIKDESSRNTAAAGAALLFGVLYFSIISLYRYKNPWYSVLPGF